MKNTFCSILLFTMLITKTSTASVLTFVANVDDNWDLFTFNPKTSVLQQLTETPLDEKEPSISADQRYVVYATTDGKLNLYDLVNNVNTVVPAGNPKASKVNPAISADSSRIAFAQQKSPKFGDDTDLMLFDMQTGKTKQIIDQYSIQAWPAWSADGKSLIYSSQTCGAGCGRIIQELWLMYPGLHWSRQISLAGSYSIQADWNPVAEELVLSSDRGASFDIWHYNISSKISTQLTNYEGMDTNPAWSPDGKKIAFVSTRSGIMEIWIYDPVKKVFSRLAPFGEKNVECKDVDW